MERTARRGWQAWYRSSHPAKIERKDRTALVINTNVAGTDLIIVRDAGQHHIDTSRLGERIANERRKVVLTAQNQQRQEVAGGAHTLDNLGLSAGDVLAAAQNADVRGTNLAYDGKVGIGRLGQALNLVKWFMPISSTRPRYRPERKAP